MNISYKNGIHYFLSFRTKNRLWRRLAYAALLIFSLISAPRHPPEVRCCREFRYSVKYRTCGGKMLMVMTSLQSTGSQVQDHLTQSIYRIRIGQAFLDLPNEKPSDQMMQSGANIYEGDTRNWR